MARTTVREREKLLVDIDVGEQVREDLRISAPTTGPSMLAGPSMSSGPSMSGLKMRAGPTMVTFGTGPELARKLELPKPPPAAIAHLAHKLQNVLMDGDYLPFTLVHDDGELVETSEFENHCDAPFYLSSFQHVLYAVDEWANSEYEHYSDHLYESDGLVTHPGFPGQKAFVDPEDVVHAWEEVAFSRPLTEIAVSIQNEAGIPIEHTYMTAAEIMQEYGMDDSMCFPLVVIAREVAPEDWAEIVKDEEVYLNGYRLVGTNTINDFNIAYIAPPN